MSFDTDVAVVGAGVAGLAAAAALRRAGMACEVLEATNRTGGRAWTDHPAALDGADFDHGASWLHDAERNKLADLARRHGDALGNSGAEWTRRVRVGDRDATASELSDYDHAWKRFSEIATARAAHAPDTSVADAVAGLHQDPWTATVENWEASLIAAADPADFSVRDWHLNELNGSNLTVPGGLGALVARRLTPLAGPVRLATPVTRIAWNAAGVTVTTPAATLIARACIVTVSTGVLGSGRIEFDPPLPQAQRDAIAGLPMGLLTKVALHAATPDRLGVAPGTSLHRRLAHRGEPAMFFLAWPNGQNYLLGFVGGAAAWELSRAGTAATEDFARAELARVLGADAAAGFDTAIVTDWGENPAYLGAYAYARPGFAGARAAMDAPLAGTLLFAGEAWCSDGLAGTVGGAFVSGERAARLTARLLNSAAAPEWTRSSPPRRRPC
jgi:monoamine oxidase